MAVSKTTIKVEMTHQEAWALIRSRPKDDDDRTPLDWVQSRVLKMMDPRERNT